MLPYMQQQDIEALDSLFAAHRPKTILEWGCGGSTVYFPKLHSSIEWWYSIEHDLKWIEKIRRNIASNVTVHCFSNDYVSNFVTKRIASIADCIIIDGVYRRECMEFAFDKCKHNAIVIVHDACRSEYGKWLETFPYARQLTKGRVPEANGKGFKRDGISIFSKDESITRTHSIKTTQE